MVREIGRRAERRVVQHRYMRPPGSLDEVAFLASCTRCGDCLEVCPVRAIIKVPTSGGLAAGTPMIDPKLQPCVVCDDMLCAAACPTEALTVPPTGWRGISLGTLELLSERCIAFDSTECGACAESCPVGADALGLDDGGRPVLRPEGCVGCGVCVRACVTSPSSLELHY
jgi:ferredoxin-type protein NapG